jgi:hypothetical protein
MWRLIDNFIIADYNSISILPVDNYMLVKKKRKKYTYKESDEQSAFFDWLDIDPAMRKVSQVSMAIPNARRSSWFMGKKRKREGVRAGVPDVFIAWPHGKYHGLFIEHKVKDEKPSKVQIKRMGFFTEVGYHCVVSYSADESIEAVKKYIGEQSC